MKRFFLLTLLSCFLFSCEIEDVVPTSVIPPNPIPQQNTSLSIQTRLDKGESPYSIYKSDNSLLPALYGKTYQGGVIAYLNTQTGTGIIAAPMDQKASIWGCKDLIIDGADNNAIGSGKQNTYDIEAGCSLPETAADICSNLQLNGYSDWFLPSRDELKALYKNLHLNSLGNFSSNFYWSSTEQIFGGTNEGGSQSARVLDFSQGMENYVSKQAELRVRAIRYF